MHSQCGKRTAVGAFFCTKIPSLTDTIIGFHSSSTNKDKDELSKRDFTHSLSYLQKSMDFFLTFKDKKQQKDEDFNGPLMKLLFLKGKKHDYLMSFSLTLVYSSLCWSQAHGKLLYRKIQHVLCCYVV